MHHGPIQPYGAVPGVVSGIVRERSSVQVVVFSILTCGIYALYWVYKTSEELRDATGDPSINPSVDVLLSVVTCFAWMIYVLHRDAQKTHQASVRINPARKDQTQTILIMAVLSLVTGVTLYISLYLLQEEMNELARATRT